MGSARTCGEVVALLDPPTLLFTCLSFNFCFLINQSLLNPQTKETTQPIKVQPRNRFKTSIELKFFLSLAQTVGIKYTTIKINIPKKLPIVQQ